MRIVVLGYQEMGAAGLEAFLSLPAPPQAEVVGVATHPDDPGENLWFRSVRRIAEAGGIPVRLVEDGHDPAFLDWLRSLAPDLLFSLYFRQVLPTAVLAIPRVAALNLHGSLLPKYRGRAPTNWAVLHGETETGVTLHYMTEKPDAGDIVAQRAVPIGPEETAFEVFRKQVDAARALLADVWPLLTAGTAPRIPQDHARATTYGRRRPEDGRIDWTRPAAQVANLVRAVAPPYPEAFTSFRGKRLFIASASARAEAKGTGHPGEVLACRSDGILVAAGERGTVLVRSCHLPGTAPESGAAFAAVQGVEPGEILGLGKENA